jgi:hypothetical protein
MARTFNRAYDQADRILNGSGLSSIVYRQGSGSIIGRGLKRAYRGLPSTAKFYLQQFQDKPMTDKEVKETLTESEINELNKAIERNQAAPKGGERETEYSFQKNPTIPGPVKDEEGNILFDPEGQVTWNTPGYQQRGYSGISDFFPGDPLFNLQNTMGQFYYGPANLAGEREIYDRYNWHMGDVEGLRGALKHGDLKWFLENVGGAYQDYKGREGRPISFTVNPYKDQWKFNPKTGEYIYPEGQGPSQQNTGKDHTLSSLEGYSEETSPSGVTTASIDDMAIDTTAAFKHGGQTMPGGLSGIKKSININGQPHSLAWINPGEASALKAMGGSGKPGPMGIPSYQETDTYSTQFDDYVAEDLADTVGPDEGGYSWDWGPTGGYDYATDTRAEGPEKTGYSDEALRDYATGLGTTVRGLGPIGTKRATAEHHDQLTDMRKGILGLYGDRMTRGEALEGAKRSAFTTWRNTVGKYSTDTAKDYDEWFAKQDPNALIRGYKYGDPVGQAMQSSFDIVNQQLKKRFKTARDDIAVGLDDDEEFEMTREELADIIESAKVEGLEDFTPYTGLDYPAWMPFGMAGKAMDFFSRTVIGTGTVGGVGVHLHKDGSITAISPEDSPGYDHEAQHEPGSESIPRRRRGPPPIPQPDPLEPELTGIAAELAKRPEVASIAQSRQAQFDNIARVFGREEAAKMLNLPENIFAEVGLG